jgi:predicted ATPase
VNTTLIKIKNILGIRELQLNGASVEITGTNGTGKSSVLDAIRYALTNAASRDIIIRQGENEAEILLETDSGLHIERKKRANMSDYKQVRENGRDVPSPESRLREIFTPLQIDPVAFTQMPKEQQNRIILDLIEFPWDLNWVREKFGEIPDGVDYAQNILQVLAQIQSENGRYFQRRQEINRDIRAKKAVAESIAKDIPPEYQAERWEQFDLSAKYKRLGEVQQHNANIQRAKTFREGFQNKLRGLEANRDIAINAERQAIASKREGLLTMIERLKAEIAAAEGQLSGLDAKLADKTKLIQAEHETAVAKLRADTQVADEWADKDPIAAAPLQEEITTAEAMKRHLNEHARMKRVLAEVDDLEAQSKELTRKIDLARTLPGEILKTATIPVEGLSVKDGVPLIHGLPVTNLSEGEQLDLCVDVTLGKPGTLQIILIDGAEKLSDANRARLYEKCKAKGIQMIATRTTNDDELVVTQL